MIRAQDIPRLVEVPVDVAADDVDPSQNARWPVPGAPCDLPIHAPPDYPDMADKKYSVN